jgi:tetratricopeptide (TPR) repeat protein
MDTTDDYLNRARWKMVAENYQGAIEDYSKVIESIPDDPDLYFSRAFAHVMVGNKEAACVDYGKAKNLGHKEADNIIQRYCKQVTSFDIIRNKLP